MSLIVNFGRIINMRDKELSIVVKVGTKPAICLNNCLATRVILCKDIEHAVEKNNSKIVIVEDFDDRDIDTIRIFIDKFIGKSTDNKVLFLISDSGCNKIALENIAYESNIDVCRSTKEVYDKIFMYTSINVSNIFDYDYETVHERNSSQGNDEIPEQEYSDYDSECFDNEELDIEYEEADEEIEAELLNSETSEDKETPKEDELRMVIRALRDELSAIKLRYEKIVNSGPVIEDPISLSEYKKVVDECNGLKSKVTKLESSIGNCNRELDRKERVILVKDEELQELRDRIAYEREEHTNEVARLKKELSKIDEYSDKLEKYEYDIIRYRKSADLLREDNAKLSDKITELAELTSDSLDETERYRNKLNLEIDYRKETVYVIQSIFEKLKEKIEELDEVSRNLIETEKKLETALKTNENIRTQNGILNNELVEAYEKNKEKDLKIEMLENELKEACSNDTYDSDYSEILARLESVNNENAKLRNEKVEYERQIVELSNRISSMNDTHSYCDEYDRDVCSLSKINYTGKASVITIFGGGGCGVTTTAMSLLNRIGTTASTLYIDFNTVCPSGDAWFRRSPVCTGLNGINAKDRRNSALGILFSNGVDFVLDNIDDIIVNIEKTRGGRIDYLSGVYRDIKDSEVSGVDYEKLLNCIGNMYEYIIIDAGRIGGNNTIDNVIKAIADISMRVIVVSIPNRFDVRCISSRIKWLEINNRKIAWLFNMAASDGKIEKLCIDTIGNSSYGVITYDNDIREQSLMCRYKTFNSDKKSSNASKFDIFLNSVIFK